MADRRPNDHHRRQTRNSAPYINPYTTSDDQTSEGESPRQQDHASATNHHPAAFHHHPANPAPGHQITQGTVPPQQPHGYSYTALPTVPPSYPTLSLANPFTAPSDMLMGFHPPSQFVADNLAAADASAATSSSRPARTDTYCATYRPLAPGENLFDPGMESARRNAIVGGFVDREGRETPEASEMDSEVERYLSGNMDGRGKAGKEGGDGKGKGKIGKKMRRGKRGGYERRGRGANYGRGGGRGGSGGAGGYGGAHGHGGYGGGMGGAGMAVR